MKKNKLLGSKIHKLLNITLVRKLTVKEYTQLVLYIAGVFDLSNSPEVKALKKVLKDK
jgi:hypothetical protein